MYIDQTKTTLIETDAQDKVLIAWVCPCGCCNVDDFLRKTYPLCDECLDQFDWDDILTDDQFCEAIKRVPMV